MNEPLDPTALSLEKVVELARSIGTGMLVSHSPEGLRSRPMSVAEITDQGFISSELPERRPENRFLSMVVVIELVIEVLPGHLQLRRSLS